MKPEDPVIVNIPPNSCTNCLFAHFVDDRYGWCEYYIQLPARPLADERGKRMLINRSQPHSGCPVWQSRFMTKKLGIN